MKKVVFNTFNFAPSFLGPSLNMLQSAIDEGHEVYYVTCLKSFKSCGFNTLGLHYMCGLCKYRFGRAIGEVKGSHTIVPLSDICREEDLAEAQLFVSGLDAIGKQTFFESFDVGESVMSSYISKTRDRDLELKDNTDILQRIGRQAVVVYIAMKRFLKENGIGQVILFNGRWDYYRATLRAAFELGIPCLVYENLRDGGFIETFENSLPHIIKNKQNNYDSFWAGSEGSAERKEIAGSFFKRKRDGEVVVDRAYTGKQVRSYVPPEILSGGKLIVMFTSSDDEIAAIGGDEYSNPLFRDQAEGIVFVADLVGRELPDCTLVIRMHPNLIGLKFGYLNPLFELKDKYSNVFLITPESKVDSYALIDKAFKVISFGSSMGIEANYWRKPVILLAKAFYYYSDVAYIPAEKSEIRKLITEDMPPKDVENSEKIGYYLMRGGIKAPYYYFEFGRKYKFKELRLDVIPFFVKNYFRMMKVLRWKN